MDVKIEVDETKNDNNMHALCDLTVFGDNDSDKIVLRNNAIRLKLIQLYRMYSRIEEMEREISPSNRFWMPNHIQFIFISVDNPNHTFIYIAATNPNHTFIYIAASNPNHTFIYISASKPNHRFIYNSNTYTKTFV